MAMGPISKMEEKPALTAELPSLSSYLLRFKKLCENDCTVKTEVLECRLNLSLDGFRSVLWARWLGILSSNIKTWEKDIGTSREKYERLKSNHLDDKRRSDNLHPSINNPLSQDKNSPWAQFFKDSELRKDIERDVIRSTSEEVRSQDQIKNWMQNILFVYGKEHLDLQYRQGMHEILSSVLLVMLDDISSCQKVVEAKGAPESSTLTLIQKLLNPDMIEQDGYALFEKIMEYMWDWYYTAPIELTTSPPNIKNVPPSSYSDNNTDEDYFPTVLLSNAARRLQNMWVNILQLHDKELYDHLVSMDILPTTFGVNWTKLLFTRQFTDYNLVWDAVMVSKFTLVDYIVVAMVMAIRSKLIIGDSNDCNMILVAKYPVNVSPHFTIRLALYLQDAKTFVRPTGSPYITISDTLSDYSNYYQDMNVEYSKKIKTKNNRKGSVGRKEDNISDQDLVLKHLEIIQNSVSNVEDEIKRSACDHQKVHKSLKQVKDAISIAMSEISQSQPSASTSTRSQNLTKIKRSTSIAVEALAYQ